MATITASGLSASGLDVGSLVSQLMAAERQGPTQRLDSREAELQTRISALGTFKGGLSSFQAALANVSNLDASQRIKATSTNDKMFSASASAGASVGGYSIKVEQLAQRQRLVTAVDATLTDPGQTVVGTGTLTFQLGTYGGSAAEGGTGTPTFIANPDQSVKTVTIDSTNNTLYGIRDAINKANIGIQASVINDGNGWRLSLGSTATGADNSLKISVSGDSEGTDTDMTGLSRLAHDPTLAAGAGQNMIQTLAARDARAVIDGLTVTSASNTFDKAIDRVSFTVNSVDATAATLNITDDTSVISNGVQSFVKAFNDLSGLVTSLTSYNATTKQGGALQSDFSVRSIFGQIRSELNKAVTGASTQFDSLADLGITTERNGTLKVDSAKLNKAITADAQGVAGLFASAGRTSDSQISYVGSTSASQVGEYAVAVSQLATQGSYLGAVVGAGPFTIDATNNTFALKVNSAQSSTLTLTAGSYTSSALIAELQSRINGDSTLQAASASISVGFSATTNRFSFTSNTYGSASTVEFTAVGATAQATLGFSVGAGTTGLDVEGTIGGETATGSGRKLTGASGSATGISIEVQGNATGDRGTVSYSDGLSARLNTLLTGVLGSSGPLTSRTDSLNKQVEKITDQRAALETRLLAIEEDYRDRFMFMDQLVSQFTATGAFLTQQFKDKSSG